MADVRQGDNQIQGVVAHDAAISGNPVRAGGRARTSDVTSVANDDAADFITDVNGKQIVLPYAIPENAVDGSLSSDLTDTTSTSLVAAQGAGIRFYMTSLQVTNSDATTSTVVKITDGSGGTLKHRLYALAGGGGYTVTFPTPIRFSANTAVHIVCETTGATIQASAQGYKAP